MGPPVRTTPPEVEDGALSAENITSAEVRRDDNAGGGARGLRATITEQLGRLVSDRYGIDWRHPVDLGGSSNLNVQVGHDDMGYVVRVYRPYVSADRLRSIHEVRHQLESLGVPCNGLLKTLDNRPWLSFEGRLVEVERFVLHDAHMDTWQRLRSGVAVLARIHNALRTFPVAKSARTPLFANYTPSAEARSATAMATARIRRWPDVTEAELASANDAERLAAKLAELEDTTGLPMHLVHGDFWDNNVFFRGDRLVYVTDFDSLGERPRIEDLALTLYFAALAHPELPVSDEQLRMLAELVDIYDDVLDIPLSPAERNALPLAVARQPLWSVGGWVRLLDSNAAARRHLLATAREIEWAHGVLDDVERWNEATASANRVPGRRDGER